MRTRDEIHQRPWMKFPKKWSLPGPAAREAGARFPSQKDVLHVGCARSPRPCAVS